MMYQCIVERAEAGNNSKNYKQARQSDGKYRQLIGYLRSKQTYYSISGILRLIFLVHFGLHLFSPR